MNNQPQNIGANSNNNKQYQNCTFNENQVSQGKDTETIIALINYISLNAKLHEGDLESTMPDPEEKIVRRFSKYCDEIKSEIVESSYYAIAQREAENVIGLDKVSIGKITAYLKRLSRRKLRENNNDPIKALDSLEDYFKEILEKEKDLCFDINAIRYYLIGEIPKCNVFPN